MMKKDYIPSRQIASFAISSFVYYDGALVLDKLSPGMTLDIVPERDNPYDPDALALYFEGLRIGYIPREYNELPSKMMHYGHADVFEVRIMQVAPLNHPSKQVHAGLYVVDAR